MPNFYAEVRINYRSVAGQVFSAGRQDIVEDPTNPGYAKEWINRARGVPSIPQIRYPGDPAPTYLGGRWSNASQPVHAIQPALAYTGGGDPMLVFDRSRLTSMFCEQESVAFPGSAKLMAMSYQLSKGADATAPQVVAADFPSQVLEALRLDPFGDGRFILGASTAAIAGDIVSGIHFFTGESGGGSTWTFYNLPYTTGTSSNEQIPANSRLWIGADPGGIAHLDGTLSSLHMWMGEISPLTRDFILQTLSEDGGDYSAGNRAVMEVVSWTDLTGDLALNQIDRLRPITGYPHLYIKGTVPSSGGPYYVQVGASVDGIVEPDSALGGDLFTYTVAEYPGALPTIVQDAGWSAVADIEVTGEGHYTIIVDRPSGGSMVLHYDIEVEP